MSLPWKSLVFPHGATRENGHSIADEENVRACIDQAGGGRRGAAAGGVTLKAICSEILSAQVESREHARPPNRSLAPPDYVQLKATMFN